VQVKVNKQMRRAIIGWDVSPYLLSIKVEMPRTQVYRMPIHKRVLTSTARPRPTYLPNIAQID